MRSSETKKGYTGIYIQGFLFNLLLNVGLGRSATFCLLIHHKPVVQIFLRGTDHTILKMSQWIPFGIGILPILRN